MDKILSVLVEFQQQSPNIYIGGSVSLILQNIIPPRIPHDIDIISPYKTHIFEIFNVIDREHHRIAKIYRYKDLKFDLYYNPKAQYIEHEWKGNILKISPADEIYEWKLRETNIKREKHLNDIEFYKKYLSL
jgi:hypothetical protein